MATQIFCASPNLVCYYSVANQPSHFLSKVKEPAMVTIDPPEQSAKPLAAARYIAAVVALASVCGCGLNDDTPRRVERYKREITKLGPYADQLVERTQDSRHVGYVVERDGQMCVCVDGREVSCHQEVGRLVLSNDGSRVAVKAKNGENWQVVVDGRADPVHGSIKDILFSPDGARLAYVASDDRGLSVVVDGKEGPFYDDLAATSFFSGGGFLRFGGGLAVSAVGQFGYVAKANGKWRVVLDQQAGPELDGIKSLAVRFDSQIMSFRDFNDIFVNYGSSAEAAAYSLPLVFAPAGSRAAIISAVGEKWAVVVDNERGALYDDIEAMGERGQPVFSSDGEHFSYVAKKGAKWAVVIDEEEQPEFDAIGSSGPMFSPSGRQVAYTARDGELLHAVVGGNRGTGYADGVTRPIFSPDGQRYAHLAWRGDKVLAVVDGQPGPEYEAIGGLTFGGDGSHIAYRGKTDEGWHAVVDGKQGPAYDSIYGAPIFSPAGESVTYAAKIDGHWLMVVAGERVAPYSDTDTFDYSLDDFEYNVDGTRHAYNARRVKGKIDTWFVKVDAEEPLEYERAWRPVFSPGGAHVAWVARDAGKEFVVLDGQRDPDFSEVLTRVPLFREDGALEYLAWKERDLYRVVHLPVE